MKTLAMTYSYSLLPVMVRLLRQEPYCLSAMRAFVDGARRELKARQAKLQHRRTRFSEQIRSRTALLSTNPCFECEHRALLFALESLNSLEAFLDSRHPSLLNEALADFGASEMQFEKLLRLRKRLPAALEEDLQRAA